MIKPPSPWTEKSIARLKALWERGYTGGQIAAELGVSRNAVISKVHRLNLPMRLGPDNESHRLTSKLHAKRVRKLKATRAQKMGHGQTAHIAPLAAKRSAPVPMPPPEPISPSAVTLDALQSGMCRWAEKQETEWKFCGAKTIPGQSWCAGHRARVFQPIDPDRLRRREIPQREKTFYELEREKA